MHKVKLLLGSLLVALVLSLAMGGCASKKTEEPKKETKQESKSEVQQTTGKLDLQMIMNEWDSSGHSKIVEYPNKEDNCIACHDGYAFAKGIKELAKLPVGRKVDLTGGKPPAAPKPGEKPAPTAAAITSQDCMSCHAGKGLEIAKSGTVSTPTKKDIKAGASALCISCHNPRKVPDIKDEKQSAPHHSAQSDVFYGSGGIQTNLKLTNSPHTNIENPCIYCHMPKTDKGQASHSFKPDAKYIKKTCGKCHQGISNFNPEAKEDYDGNGKKEGFQDEVKGLMDAVRGAIGKKLNGGKFESGGGKFTFKDASGKAMKAPDDVYMATYNLSLIEWDNSKGVHNPSFTVQMLQQSYKALTGKDVPNAKLK